MKLSVIVPVYNTERFLHKCINSILLQTFTDFELILVDDGSTDDSSYICNEYAKKDSRIIIIHKENGGQSDARNLGLDKSNGDYIVFVDSDDYIESTMFEELYNIAIKNNSDMVCSKHNLVNENYTVKKYNANTNFCEIFDGNFVINNYSSFVSKLQNQVTCKIYAKKLFEELRFQEGIIYEDAFILPDLIEKSNKVIFYDKGFYNYLQHSNSTMHASYDYKRVSSIILSNKLINFFEERDIETQKYVFYISYLENYIQNHIAIHTKYTQYKNQFKPYVKQAKKRIFKIIFNPNIFGAKKLLIIYLTSFISPKLEKKLCMKFHPEILWIMR